MISLRIERHGSQFTEDVMDDCQHADFFFSNGCLASCYHNEEHMITEYYQKPMNIELFGPNKADELWQTAADNKVSYNEWPNKQKIDEEMITDILDYYAPEELITITEEEYE